MSIDPSPDRHLINPVVEYDHNPSETLRVPGYLAVVGGFVYRGSKIPELRGKYVCADLTGFLFVADLETGKIAKLIDSGIFIKGFGEDDDGEIYALGSPELGPSGADGMVLAIRPSSGEAWESPLSHGQEVQRLDISHGPGERRPGRHAPAFRNGVGGSPEKGRNAAGGPPRSAACHPPGLPVPRRRESARTYRADVEDLLDRPR